MAMVVQCQLIIGKSKVAPLKRVTILRLELCGAVLAAKLIHYVATTYQDRLHIDNLFAWIRSSSYR